MFCYVFCYHYIFIFCYHEWYMYRRQYTKETKQLWRIPILLCAQANSASYPQWDGKWVVAHGLRGEGLVRWLGRWYVCELYRGSNCSPSRAMDGRIMRHGIISSYQSAATSEIVKRCCSSLVSSAITSTQTFTFTFTSCSLKEMFTWLTHQQSRVWQTDWWRWSVFPGWWRCSSTSRHPVCYSYCEWPWGRRAGRSAATSGVTTGSHWLSRPEVRLDTTWSPV